MPKVQTSKSLSQKLKIQMGVCKVVIIIMIIIITIIYNIYYCYSILLLAYD